MSSAAAKPTALKAPLLGKSGSVDLDPSVFGEPFNNHLVHEIVRAEQNARRRGTASSLSRGQIAMTGAKAWRQKGTGRARVGALSAPHRRGGGKAFGPKPRGYTSKINRKARRKALRAVLSLHAERGSLAILDSALFTEPSTKQAATVLAKWQADGSVFIVVNHEVDVTSTMSLRNIRRVRGVMSPDQTSVVDLMAARNLVISQACLDEMTRIAQPEVERRANAAANAAAVSPTKAVATEPEPVATKPADAEPVEADPVEAEAAEPSEQEEA